jgi:chromate transport protein ChrA
MFNLAAYVGAVINGAVAGIVSWVVLYLPALFVVWGILPYW